MSTFRVGQTQVVLLDPAGQSHGGYSMPNTSVWPNDASVCSLSEVLEMDSVPAQYFLSPKACAGILRRAEKPGKALPSALRQALEAVVTTATGTEASTRP